MKIAVLSDFHGNHDAFTAIKSELDTLDIDLLFCLGDYVGYYYQPHLILKSLEEYETVMLKGNHESMLFDLIDGNLAVDDLPEAWNSKFEEYLSIRPPDDRQGVLQDIHWADGYFGYFPTYTLGNLISVQLWQKLSEDLPDLEVQISRGEFGELIGWLNEKIHRHGGKFEPMDLLKRVTGEELRAKPYLKYLTDKYSEIYNLS